ncbi:MAG: M12 family metallo-peptidase [Phycisphaerales bacterium]
MPGLNIGRIAVLFAASCCVAGGAVADTPTPSRVAPDFMHFTAEGERADAIKSAVGLSASTVFSIPETTKFEEAFTVEVPIAGVWSTLELRSHSVRSLNYKLFVQGADGQLTEVEPGPVTTFRGHVAGSPGSAVAGAWTDSGFEAQIVTPDGINYFVEPARKYLGDAPANEYFTYRNDHVTNPGGECGVDIDPGAKHNHNDGIIDNGTGDCGGMCVAQIGCDADFEFYQDFGSSVTSVENRINLVLNATSNQYESQCGIQFEISGIVVRTAEPDPYSSSDGGTLLNQLQSEWLSNQGGIEHDIIHLFTGKDITTPGQGNSTIGIASVGVVCTNNDVGTVENFSPNSCAFDLSAHEIGHNWSAQHCCAGTTMNSSLTCANNFAQQSIDEIVAHRNSRTCLDPLLTTLPLPFSDTFPAGALDSSKWTSTGAAPSTVGNGEPSAPNSCRIRGTQELTSAPLAAAAVGNLTVSYWWQRTGGGNSPESGEDLYVEYRANNGSWVSIATHPGAGSDTDPFQFESFVMTDPGAYHNNFAIRFRNPDGELNQDDFFVDDVTVSGVASPPGNFALVTPVNGATGVTQGPLFLDWDPAPGAANYSVIVDDDPAFGSPLFSIGATLATQLNLGLSFTEGIPYYWRVTANNINGSTFGTPNPSSFIVGTPIANCPGDTNGSNSVDVDDLNAILGVFNTSVGMGSPLDLANDDGFVDVDDLNVVLGNWGTTCP